jgi:hypothetical protein
MALVTETWPSSGMLYTLPATTNSSAECFPVAFGGNLAKVRELIPPLRPELDRRRVYAVGSGVLDGVWLFAERLLYVDWMDERALS